MSYQIGLIIYARAAKKLDNSYNIHKCTIHCFYRSVNIIRFSYPFLHHSKYLPAALVLRVVDESVDNISNKRLDARVVSREVQDDASSDESEYE